MLRKTILKNCLLLVIAAMTFALHSCSKEEADRRADLLALTSADDMLTLTAEPSQVLKSAGFTFANGKITAPDNLRRVGDTDKFTEAVNAAGVNYHNLVISGQGNNFYCLIALDDKNDFVKSLSDEWECVKTGGFDVMGDNGGYFIIDNDIAIFVPADSADEAAAKATAIKDAAKLNPRPQWQIERLSRPNDMNILISVAKIAETAAAADKETAGMFKNLISTDAAYSFCSLNFDGPSLKCANGYLNADGEATDFTDPSKITSLNDRVLALAAGRQIVAAFSVPETLKNYFASIGLSSDETDAYVNAVTSFAFIGSVNGANFMSPDNYSAAIVLTFDADKRATISNGLNRLAAMAADFNTKASRDGDILTFISDFNRVPVKFYAAIHDDYVVITNDTALTEKATGPSPVSGTLYSYCDIELKKKDFPLALAGCPFGIHITGHAGLSEGEATVTLTETDGGFIENIINFASKF